jgi:hypothetical protein
VFCVADCIRDSSSIAIPQPTEWQRIGDQINAAMIFARTDFVNVAAEVKKEIELEIAHVLFTDIVGYSKLPIHQQRAAIERLNEIVLGTDEFQAAETAGRLIKIPTGDGIT